MTPQLETRFGPFGGRYLPELFHGPLEDLTHSLQAALADPLFMERLQNLRRDFIGRPTPLYRAEKLSQDLGLRVYLKLEGAAHTGAHKINNALGQALLAQRMGKKLLIAETGAGQHGVATATAAAQVGLPCRIFMGSKDMARQHPNVLIMRMLGAEVIGVDEGSATLKDAVNAALRHWAEDPDGTYYLLGSALGPHPYPAMVREFQRVIGDEVREEILRREGELPRRLLACIGGGSNAIGLFAPFLEDPQVQLFGVEAGGQGPENGRHASRMCPPAPEGIVQGYRSLFLQDGDGQVAPTASISAGLDYPGLGPQLAHLGQSGRIRFSRVSDREALNAVRVLCRREGILPALESAHALAFLLSQGKEWPRDELVVVGVSGRGDKDLFITARAFDPEGWLSFLKEEVSR